MKQDPRGRRVRLIGKYAEGEECVTGIINDNNENIGPYSYWVKLDNGRVTRPYVPDNGMYDAECEFIDDLPVPGSTKALFIEYLDERISDLQKRYEECVKVSKENAIGSEMWETCNSMGANLLDRIVDHKQIKEQYIKTHQ